MAVDSNGLTLDDLAQKLYEELGGLESSTKTGKKTGGYTAGLAEALSEEEKKFDARRIIMADFAHQLAVCLSDSHFPDEKAGFEEKITSLLNILSELAKAPDHNGQLLVRSRGIGAFSLEDKAEKSDYVLWLGNLMLDLPTLKTVAKRSLPDKAGLPDRLARDFEALEDIKVNTIYLTISPWGRPEVQRMGFCIQILRRYFNLMAKGPTAISSATPSAGPPPVVFDEHRQPNSNLTLLAGLNNLKSEAIGSLVGKVQEMMLRPESAAILDQFITVHEAVFAFKNLKAQLIKPPIEVNNLRWMITGRDDMATKKEEMKVARKVMGQYANAPQKAAQVAESIFSQDFNQIKSGNLKNRLETVSAFLNDLKKDASETAIEEQVLLRVEENLRLVKDEVLTVLKIPETKTVDPSGSSAEGFNEKVHELIKFYKTRIETKKKIREMLHRPVSFEPIDYAVVARDFDLSANDAAELLRYLQSSFTKDGRFYRAAFEKNLQKFAGNGTKIFELMWQYLKEINSKEDRVALLNTLQFLIANINQPRQALNILLTDFTSPADMVGFSDRNGLMLANLLVRKYNKELTSDIEITPEEVIRVWNGLNDEVIHWASGYIDQDHEKYYQKIRAIHSKLKESLDTPTSDKTVMPRRYMFTLERETYIFLSLVGGTTAHSILKSAVKEYSDPGSEVFRLKESQSALRVLLQLLQVAIRGLGRFGDQNDRSTLNKVISREKDFLAMKKDPAFHDQVRRLMQWANQPESRPA